MPIPHSGGDGGGSSSGGGGSRGKPPKQVSLTDPQATWVARPSVNPFFAYDANYLIDNKAGIIVDAEDSGDGFAANERRLTTIACYLLGPSTSRTPSSPDRF
jgi:hypothetical protein